MRAAEVLGMKAHRAEFEELERWFDDDAWAIEPKADGIRSLLRISDGKTVAIGTSTRPLTDQSMCRHFGVGWDGEWVLDGEWLNGVLWVFDLPLSPVTTLLTPFARRRLALEQLGGHAGWTERTPVRVMPQYATPEGKRWLWEQVILDGSEGVMAKRLDGRYESGKRSWTTRKVKFERTVDCVVTAWHPVKASIDVALWRDGLLVPVGSCSWDDPRPPIGTVAEIRCLYLGEQGRLFQPIGMRERPDKEAEECTWEQLEGLSPNRTVARATCPR